MEKDLKIILKSENIIKKKLDDKSLDLRMKIKRAKIGKTYLNTVESSNQISKGLESIDWGTLTIKIDESDKYESFINLLYDWLDDNKEIDLILKISDREIKMFSGTKKRKINMIKNFLN